MTRGFIFDLDGTVYLGEQLIEGAAEAIATLKQRGDKVVYLTNKSISSRMDYVEKLKGLGIEVGLDEVINSNFITAKFLKQFLETGEAALVIGEQPLLEELADEGIPITRDAKQARVVVLGWDRQFNYEKINLAFQAWLNKATIIATNPDRTCPVLGGEIPDCGAMIGALEGATGQRIESITGKPSKWMAEYVVSKVLKLHPSQCYMVGDRLETDIKMAIENGLQSVLVLTGVTNKEMLSNSLHKPSFVIDSIKEVVAL
ncbi:HAD-IIA family hydrolase [Cytobacillus purgationiresistens]|uniref:Acid sugar phosphatase n=1 Tax=Cytobacillus purgationiresistens TaxID=863449 RepID=A0ABU0AK49_9BACI|nr:HAD-IIA family hydrolase [Cytobacillus purgationiresistens]MDQ0271636.1 arabinose operon protein AraL [Cytobacillus purgationiresistens]